MATDGDGDVVMAPPAAEVADDVAGGSAAEADAGAEASAEAAPAAQEPEPGPPPEERVERAEASKEEGNVLLKAGEAGSAVEKYREGIELTESLLEKDPTEIGEDLQRRATTVYVALRLNSAQACLKSSSWTAACEHADKVLLVDAENCKALYRRGVALSNFDGRLDDAKADLARVTQLDPTNREARERLQKTKERLREVRQREKERYAGALSGGLYQEQHAKLAQMERRYQEEVERRKEAGEDEISFEDFQKKEKERIEEQKKKEKEEKEKRQKEAAEEAEKRQLEEENARRREAGEEELSLEDWRQRQALRPRREEVVKTDELELDDEEKTMLQETKNKGYYHGRLGTVLSKDAPTPVQLEAMQQEGIGQPAGGTGHSAWNQAGTWEDRDMSNWAKEVLTRRLTSASATASTTLPTGELVELSASISRCKSLTGEAQLVMVRGKKKCGYDFQAELSFRVKAVVSPGAEDSAEEKVDGYLKLPELLESVPPQDLRCDISYKGSGPPERLQASISDLLDKLREGARLQVAEFVEEYKQQ